MNLPSALIARVTAEMKLLTTEPPPGISCWPINDSITEYEAIILGVDGTPYEKGQFKIAISLPLRYPWEPPKCKFITRIYHPNVDEGGRICLDTLVMPPKGSWKPSLNLSIVLQSLRLLLGAPNPEDPLVLEVTEEFQTNYQKYAKTARMYTEKYASSRSYISSTDKKQDVNAREKVLKERSICSTNTTEVDSEEEESTDEN